MNRPGSLLACLALTLFVAARLEAAPALVGMEGSLQITIPGPKLAAKPIERKSPIVLRIASAQESNGQVAYDFRYVGLTPGKYDLVSFLQRDDGSAATGVPAMPVEIGGLLPPNHDGSLEKSDNDPLRVFGSYRVTAIVVAILWAVALVPILWWKRKRKPPPAPPPVMIRPTLADVLRPLVEKAAAGALDNDGKARLERLLLGYWRRKLQLPPTVPADEAMQQLRRHAEAGALLNALESWLHRPPGSAATDVEQLLADFQSVSAEAVGIEMPPA